MRYLPDDIVHTPCTFKLISPVRGSSGMPRNAGSRYLCIQSITLKTLKHCRHWASTGYSLTFPNLLSAGNAKEFGQLPSFFFFCDEKFRATIKHIGTTIRRVAMLSVKSNHKQIVFLVALAYLLSALAVGFHCHVEDGQHFSCPICAAGSLFSASCVQDNSAFIVDLFILNRYQTEEIFRTDLFAFPAYSTRAPPIVIAT